MDGSRIRKEKFADSKISGYVWTGPYKAATIGLDAYLTKTEGPLLQIVKKAFSVTVRRLIPSRKKLQDSETNLGSQTPSAPTEGEGTAIHGKRVKKKAKQLDL